MTGSPPEPLRGRTAAAIVELLDRERLMTLACVGSDGAPQASTVGYVNEGLDLYFIVARASRKFACLEADPRAAVAIRTRDAGGSGAGVSMTGRVFEITDLPEVEQLNRRVAERYPEVHVYCPSGDSVAVLRFRPETVSTVALAHGRSDSRVFTLEAPDAEAGV